MEKFKKKLLWLLYYIIIPFAALYKLLEAYFYGGYSFITDSTQIYGQRTFGFINILLILILLILLLC